MQKKILFLSSSLRPKSNSEFLAREAAKGAEEAGHSVEFVTLRDKTIGFCRGCLACQKTLSCVIKDDANEIAEKVRDADTLVFVTPIYYYEMSGQLKTMLDRCNPLFPQEYRFRDVYLMTTSAEDGEEVYERAANGLKGWIACFPKSRFAGVFSGGGINMEDIAKDEHFQNVREDAHKFGKNL
ncbi:MAG: flavodoxin family protein [Schwartzia sp.]|nr:flavodoxin family protein [Schwartzia sp. (in: firmicutes)]